MQETSTLARPYAVAAFKQAREQGALGGWSEALNTLGAIMADARMQAVARNPKVDGKVLTDLLLDIGGDHFFDVAQNFVRVLVEAERVLLAPQVAELFDRMKAEAEGSAGVSVLTAFELGDDDQQRIAASLEKHFKRRVALTTEVDEALIGGVVIRSGDTVIDASVKGQLKLLAQRLGA